MITAWLAVDKDGYEFIFHHKPTINEYNNGWIDKETYGEIRGMTSCASDYSIRLPKGTIKKIIGRNLTFEDKPVKLEEIIPKHLRWALR